MCVSPIAQYWCAKAVALNPNPALLIFHPYWNDHQLLKISSISPLPVSMMRTYQLTLRKPEGFLWKQVALRTACQTNLLIISFMISHHLVVQIAVEKKLFGRLLDWVYVNLPALNRSSLVSCIRCYVCTTSLHLVFACKLISIPLRKMETLHVGQHATIGGCQCRRWGNRIKLASTTWCG